MRRLRKLIKLIFVGTLKTVLPIKQKKAAVICKNRLEDNALEMANYLAKFTSMQVYLIVPKHLRVSTGPLVHPSIEVSQNFKKGQRSWKTLKIIFESRYLFYTDRSYLFASEKQTTVNLWHGVGHKKIGVMLGQKPILTDWTIACSPLTRQIFTDIFGVSKNTVTADGLPRNDLLLRSQDKIREVKKKFPQHLNGFTKILIWMPTFRRHLNDRRGPNTILKEVDNIFGIKNFDIERFNTILKENNALCLIKPHYFVEKCNPLQGYGHIQAIDDAELHKNKLSLYQFLACTDALITDFSSVMIDYSLLDRPIFCFATDLEEYKQTQGLYFEDYENYVPTEFIQSQDRFFAALKAYLETNSDPYKEKRHKVRDLYFEHQDANSAKRIAERVLETP